MPKNLKWLHISDFHCKENAKWSQDVVLQSLLNDVRQKYSGDSSPDLIFVTGDISFSGKKEEFNMAQEFIDKLSEVTRVKKDNIFFVPGNHDIDRNEEEDAIVGARTIINGIYELDRIYSNPKRLRTLFNRQKNYREFVNANRSTDLYSDCSSVHKIEVEIKSIKIRILLLDSAWLSHDDMDCKKLAVGLQQINNCIDENHCNYLVFALMHHPVSWLKEFEESLIENTLIQNVHIVLRGHVHQGDTSSIEKKHGQLIIFTAGAAYESRSSVNSYSFGKLNLFTGRGEKLSHSYSRETNNWNISGTDQWNLKLSPVLRYKEIYTFVSSQATVYPNYIACLISTLKTEVPRKCLNSYVLVNKSVSLDSGDEKIVELVDQLLWLTCFQYIWKAEDWIAQFNEKILDLEEELVSITELAVDLKSLEESCEKLLGKFMNIPNNGIDSLDNLIEDFVTTREFDKAYNLIEKWEHDVNLKVGEMRFLKRKKLEIALKENSDEKIQLGLNELTDLVDLDASELLLLSSAYYRIKMYLDAETKILQALDLGADTNQIRPLARAIAGQTGNAQLAKKVM